MEPSSFTPVASTIGGVLIGAASALALAFNGRIAGISGIFGAFLTSPRTSLRWQAPFLLGLLAGGVLLLVAMPGAIDPAAGQSFGTLVAAGLLVGFGSAMGSGCTSGHGVCGISRFSPRSIAATLTFIATGALTVALYRHVFAGPGA